VSESLALADRAGALAGEASGDAVELRDIQPNCSYVVVDGDSGPALAEDAAAPFVPLAEPGVVDAGEVESVVEEADA
jgi:hypothetical protein